MGRKNNRMESFGVRFKDNGRIKTAVVEAVGHERAERKASAFPNVISVHKLFYDRIIYHEVNEIKKTTDLMQDIAQPKMSPLAMDEFIWMRKNKRKQNLENKSKDKLDNE